MGCDIHAYIEYKESDEYECFAHPYIIRDYNLFTALAGVRSYGAAATAVVAPRGAPTDMSWRTEEDYYMRIDDDWLQRHPDAEGYVTSVQAEKWLENGASRRHPKHAHKISNPDWHSTSWLTVDECVEAQKIYFSLIHQPNLDLAACIGAMRALPHARLVVWFDN